MTALRCRPGDLAIVCAGDAVFNGQLVVGGPSYLGRVVRCLRVSRTYADTWIVENPPLLNGKEVEFEDWTLRPIRDPGDDAVDQFARQQEVAR